MSVSSWTFDSIFIGLEIMGFYHQPFTNHSQPQIEPFSKAHMMRMLFGKDFITLSTLYESVYLFRGG